MSQLVNQTSLPNKQAIVMDGFPSHLSYIFISCQEDVFINQPPKDDQKIIALTFSDENIKVKQLLLKVKPKDFGLIQLDKMALSDSEGYHYDKEWRMKDVKNHLRLDKINGYQFKFIKQEKNKKDEKDVSVLDENFFERYTTNYQNQRSSGWVQLHFQLSNSDTVITTQRNYEQSQHGKTIIQEFIDQLYKIYGIGLKPEEILSLKTKDTNVEITSKTNIWETPGLGNRSKIEVVLSNPNFKLPSKPVNQVNRIVIVDVDGDKSKEFNYEEFYHMTFENVYLKLFGKKAITSSNLFCLRIANIIIPPSDKLDKLSYIFKISDQKTYGTINLVGRVISEKVSFYLSLSQTLKHENFKFDHRYLEGDDKEEMQNRLKKTLKKTLDPKHLVFSKEENVENIYYYTTQLQYHPQKKEDNAIQDEKISIFNKINRSIENQPIIYQSEEEIKNSWVYQYTNSFLNTLASLRSHQGFVYRGINYDIEREVGEEISFKSFLSTSINPKIAQIFAIQSHLNKSVKMQQLQKQFGENYIDFLKRHQIKYYCSENKKVILQIKCTNGKDIGNFSAYSEQQQVIIEPYSTFRVIRKFNKIIEIGGNPEDFLIYELQQLEEPRDFDEGKTSFICWVDPNKQEGIDYARKFVAKYLESTVFLQLSSTTELKNWINTNKQLLQDLEAKPVFISNMTRIENGKENGLAGIESIKLIRSMLKREVPICLYIGNKQLSLKKLRDNGLQEKKDYLEVIDNSRSFVQFIKRQVKVTFTKENHHLVYAYQGHPQNLNQNNHLFVTPLQLDQFAPCECLIM